MPRPGWRTWKLSWQQLCLRREAWKSPWLTCRIKCRRYSSVLSSSLPLPRGCCVSAALLTFVCVSVIPAEFRSCASQGTAGGWDAASCWFGKSLPEPYRGDGFQEEHLRGGKPADRTLSLRSSWRFSHQLFRVKYTQMSGSVAINSPKEIF